MKRERRLFTWRGRAVMWRGFHIHFYRTPVLPDGGPTGIAILAGMAATGRLPYQCRCGDLKLF